MVITSDSILTNATEVLVSQLHKIENFKKISPLIHFDNSSSIA